MLVLLLIFSQHLGHKNFYYLSLLVPSTKNLPTSNNYYIPFQIPIIEENII